MIHLITGVPGAGKTLRSVQLISEHLKKGRKVYARIDGLQMPEVLEAPDDWRETPEGSVWVMDEAQQVFGSDHGKKGGRSDRLDIQAMETHRHTGHDLILITQRSGLIHAHVRALVGRHEHISRAFGTQAAFIRWKDRHFDETSNSEKTTASTESWAYPKELYSAYKSATMHINTVRWPRKLKMLVGLLALVASSVIFAGYRFYHSKGIGETVDDMAHREHSAATGSQVVETPASVSKPAVWPLVPEVSGCAWNARFCRCYDTDGHPIEMAPLQCVAFAERGPLPFPVHPQYRSSDAAIAPQAQAASGGTEMEGQERSGQQAPLVVGHPSTDDLSYRYSGLNRQASQYQSSFGAGNSTSDGRIQPVAYR